MPLMTDAEWDRLDGLAMAELVRKGAVTPLELVDFALGRIARLDGRINAITALEPDAARRKAEGPLPNGPFTGVPFLRKEVGPTQVGEGLTFNSRFFADYVGTVGSTVLDRYGAAGIITLGRCASPELGLCPATEPADHGPTNNPWRLDRQSGGSSGGGAAAVAAGYVPLALGGDGGGSIRLPAAHCGVYGLKPTRARTPFGPAMGEGWGGLVCIHAMTRTVRDSAAALDASHGPAPGDPYAAPHFGGAYLTAIQTPPTGLRIAMVTRTASGGTVHPEVEAAVKATARTLEALGHHVEPFDLPFDERQGLADLWLIVGANAAASVDARAEALGRPPREGELEPITRAMVERAHATNSAAYALAMRRCHALGRAIGGLFARFDVILSPVFSQPPLPTGAFSMQNPSLDAYLEECRVGMPFTWWFNIGGNPAASLPLAMSSEGTPIGVQIACEAGRDDMVLALSAALEQAMPWRDRRPDFK
jgi:Asp-tRNA(Asn)/Glu-tRNA(Gln) amidotransferase A subunit family amidase